MLNLPAGQVENYLREKGLFFRRRGNKAELALCPFCSGGQNQDRWTCVVHLDETGGNFKCMRGSCGQTGNFWALMSHFRDDPREYYKSTHQTFGTKRTQSNIAKSLKPNLTFTKQNSEQQPLTEFAIRYLKKRGFTEQSLEAVSLWCDDKGSICFGYYFEGELCMVKQRHPRKPNQGEPKAWQKQKGGLRTLWGFEQCDFTKSYIIITFGEYDRMAVLEADIDNVVSVPCGDEDLTWIEIHYDTLKELNEIYLWIDNDVSGLKVLPKIAERLGRDKIRVIKTQYKDANEMLHTKLQEVSREEAQEAIRLAVINAEWYFSGNLLDVAQITTTEQNWDGYESGFELLDKNCGGFINGCLTVHVGDAKAGKSTALNQIIAHAIKQGGKVCVWTGEDTPEDFKYKIGVHIAGFEGTEMRLSRAGTYYPIVLPHYENKVNSFLSNNLYLVDLRFGITEEILFENFNLAYERFGCDVFVLDNLMKIVSAKDTNDVNFRQTQVCNMFSDFVKDKKVHGHLAVHIKKPERSDELKPPTSKNATSGTKNIVNLCDMAVFWWRVPETVKANYDDADAVLGVLADRRCGNDGIVESLLFNKQTKTFHRNPQHLCGIRYVE